MELVVLRLRAFSLFVLSVLAFLTFSSLTEEAQATEPAPLPPGYCYKRCVGERFPVAPFDFGGKAASDGDPNTGKPLKKTMKTPIRRANGSDKVSTEKFFEQMDEFEEWTARECGESLDDPNEVVDLIGPCDHTDQAKEAWAINILSAHKPATNPPPSMKVIDAFFLAATTPEQKAARDEFPWARRGGAKTVFKKCWPQEIGAGTKESFGVYLNGNLCANFSAPPLPPGQSVVKGIPPESKTHVNAEGRAGVYVLGADVSVVRAMADFDSPKGGAVKRDLQVHVLGAMLYRDQDNGLDLKWDNTFSLGNLQKGASATFTIGPVPITVEAGAAWNGRVDAMARLTNMWANGRVPPRVDAAAYAKAFVNAFVAEAGVRAYLTLIRDTLDLYGFVGVIVGSVEGTTQFVFTSHVAGENAIEALSGRVDAFVRFIVPKWLGWRWKTYNVNLFQWEGIRANGYLFNFMLANQPIATFVNNEE